MPLTYHCARHAGMPIVTRVTHIAQQIMHVPVCAMLCLSQCIEPYLSRKPENPGDPMPYVMWQKFANHVQKIADTLGTGKPGDY
jgi:hypothetical protein